MSSLTRTEARHRAGLLDVRSYAVDLDLAMGDQTFRSTTRIRFGCREPGAASFVECRPARLHRAELNGRPLDPDALTANRLPLSGLAADNELVVEADMEYSRTGEGLHRFTDPADGLTYVYANTFLDEAQRVFACFDQPDLKASFRVSVTAPDGWTVLGNGEATEVAPGRFQLAETPPLATYFTTIVAGPYHSVYTMHDGIRLGLHCRRSLARHLDPDVEELFDVTRASFDRQHALFGVRYPFGKYDQAFVPEFNAGAMENPGCVTFNDEMVYRSAVTSAERELRAMVVAHEMAHMWFGDLVTMRWWDDLWLNESFAEYIGHRVTAEATRFTGSWIAFCAGRKTWGYAADQRPSTHPVAGEVEDGLHAILNFDGISYAKGASSLRQLAAWLGDDAFFAGLREYFARHRFANAELADLIAALTAASGRNVDGWARLWLRSAQVNTLRPEVGVGVDGRYTSVAVAQAAPADFPTLRPHVIGVGLYDRRGDEVVPRQRVEVELDPAVDGGRTPVPELVGHRRPDLLVLNDGDLTYAKIRFDPVSLDALLRTIGQVTDPLTRALLWSALWDMTRDAEFPGTRFVSLIAGNLAAETQISVVRQLVEYAMQTADLYLAGDRRAVVLPALAGACRFLVATAEPGGGRQLVAARGLARCATAEDATALRGWLAGDDVPEGLPVDPELRWAVLYRLAVLGAAASDDLEAELERDRSALGEKSAARCRAALPDATAKQAAWQLITADDAVSNHILEATAEGFWQPEHAEVTAPYVARFFTEMPDVTARRTPVVAQLLGRLAYPRFAVAESTVKLAEAMLARTDLTPALRRRAVDNTDDIRRALRARAADAP